MPVLRIPFERPWKDLRRDESTVGSNLGRVTPVPGTKRASNLKVRMNLFDIKCMLVSIDLSFLQIQRLVVQDETIEFQITLENPFSFALELVQLSLRYRTFTRF